MLPRLFLLFTIIPLVELYLLIHLGTYIGALPTVGIVVGTGLAGGLLARSQGLAVLQAIREGTNEGRLPAGRLFDGLLILIAGALLVTPGLLTDVLGLYLMLPFGRQLIKDWLRRKVQEKIHREEIQIYTQIQDRGPF